MEMTIGVPRPLRQAAKDEIDPEPDATIGRAPDAPAPQKMEKNPVVNKREVHPPPLPKQNCEGGTMQ